MSTEDEISRLEGEAGTVEALQTAKIIPDAKSESIVQSQGSEDRDMSDEPIASSDGGDLKAEIKEILSTMGVAIAVVMIARTLIFQPFTIPSASMEPNLYEGEYISTSKWDYGWSKHSILFSPPLPHGRVFEHAPQRGDIIVFKLPRDTKQDFIKRLIGLPGDHVQVINNQLFINGAAVPTKVIGTKDGDVPIGQDTVTELSESLPGGKTHLMQDWRPDSDADNTKEFIVPAGYYFMMGDNRDNSEDSRFSASEGGVDFVPAENLEGKAQFILLSWKPGSNLWKPWTWLNLRWNRFFKGLQ